MVDVVLSEVMTLKRVVDARPESISSPPNLETIRKASTNALIIAPV
jgi:hypothetical protein